MEVDELRDGEGRLGSGGGGLRVVGYVHGIFVAAGEISPELLQAL